MLRFVPTRELLVLAVHLLVTFAKLLHPGGVRAVVAESLLLKHQLPIGSRSRRHASNLTALDRFLLGLTALFVSPRRIAKLGALVKPATVFGFQQACDPLFRFHRWLANLRVLDIEEIKSVPYAPVSHPFIERLIGTLQREYLDRVFFWTRWT